MSFNAFAAKAAASPLEPFTYDPHDLGTWDIEVAISHCGICYSDIHLIDNDWHMSQYPMVPGHEIIGTITEKGSSVTDFEIGQRVGIGWQRSACLVCETCLSGHDNICPNSEATCAGHYGGFSDNIRADSRFAFTIPDELESEKAGPLLCGGITTYSPFRLYGIQAHMKVGVIGIGGLGHLALQFANAFGCEVTAFSTSPDKEAEAREFGAHRFIPSDDPRELKYAALSLDFLISTVHADLDWPTYLNILKPNGKICFVGAAPQPIPVPVMLLIMGQRSVCGSAIGSRDRIREMLEFCAQHGIRPKTEHVAMADCNGAIDKVRTNRARYRMVLHN